MGDETFDVMVIGAGAAGAAAATLLALKERNVVLLDRATFPRKTTSAGWLNVRAAPLLAEMSVPVRSLLSRAFTDVTFFNADFTKNAKPNFQDAPGYLIDRAEFGDALVKAARASATVHEGCAVKRIQAKETTVVATLDNGQEITAKLLLLASGKGSDLVGELGLASADQHATMWTAQVDVATKKNRQSAPPHVAVVLGLDRLGSFAVCCASRERLSVSVNWLGEKEEALPAFVQVAARLFTHQVTPIDVTEAAAVAEVYHSPASAALEMDTHVGKHTLLIGDAGGFVSAASNEGLYPAMWSAQLASEVIDTALSSPQSQDELMAFESKWRIAMADYLRAPNTDVQFLLPLIFSNQPMADRMGSAFFSGENI